MIREIVATVAVLALPSPVLAQSVFDGTWKADISSAQLPEKPDVYVLKGGMYSCKSCVPPYTVKADGSDQKVSGHPYYDTVSVQVVDDHTVHEIDKLKGKATLDTTSTVAADGKTVTYDGTNNTGTAPVTYKATAERVGKERGKAHALSGKWRITSYANISDTGVMATYKVSGGSISFSTPTGSSYTAKLDGTEAPNMGDPGVTTVSVKQIGRDTLEETDKRDGKVVAVEKSTVAADGKSMSVKFHDVLHGTTMSYTAKKI